MFCPSHRVRRQDDEEIIRTAMASPEHYVLKPQREGGGHNFYGTLAELLGLWCEHGGKVDQIQQKCWIMMDYGELFTKHNGNV